MNFLIFVKIIIFVLSQLINVQAPCSCGSGEICVTGCQWCFTTFDMECCSNCFDVSGTNGCCCPTGTGGGGCPSCPAGQYANQCDNACSNCPAGTASSGGGGFGSCNSCGSGSYAGAGSGSCTPCNPGYYASGSGNSFCPACPEGQYSVGLSNSGCTLCSPGNFNTGTANTGCSQCSPGHYQDLPGQNYCKDAAPGQYVNIWGSPNYICCAAGSNSTLWNRTTPCDLCQAGFSIAACNTLCDVCPAGTFTISGQYPCQNCPIRTFSPHQGQPNACIQCKAGTYQDQTGQTTCKNCTAGTYSADNANICTLCNAGQFSFAGSSYCSACPPGSVSGATIDGTCDICGLGYYSPGNLASCQLCGIGQITNQTGMQACITCQPGTYKSSGSTCTLCSQGYYSLGGVNSCTICGTGTTSVAGSSACISCGPGQFKNTGNNQCEDCPAGERSNIPIDDSCTPCLAGEYSNKGSSSCIQCLAGYSTNGIGSSSQCSQCQPGYFSAALGTGSCSQCGIGQYTSNYGSTSCNLCQQGTYYVATRDYCMECGAGKGAGVAGQTCAPCAVGEFSKKGEQCQSCQPGHISASPPDEFCDECSQGTYSLANSGSCLFCNPGESSFLASSSCYQCPVGYYSNTSVSFICKKCPIGTFANVPGSAICTPCNIGYYGPQEGLSECNLCPKNFFQENAGLSFCNDCKSATSNSKPFNDGTLAAVSSQFLCIECGDGHYYSSTIHGVELDCYRCPINTYASPGGGESCTLCTNGMTSVEGQASCINCADGMSSISGQPCFYCNEGEYSQGAPLIPPICQQCLPGQYSDKIGTISCTLCPIGYYQPLAGQTSCLKCDDGKYCNGGSQVTTGDCLGGQKHQQNDLSYINCINCGVGYYSPAASAYCYPCLQGTYSNNMQQPNACIDCIAGSISNETGRTECILCEPGTIAPTIGLSICSDCIAGTYNNLLGQAACMPCLAGQYSNVKAEQCINCSAGYYSGPSSANCLPCLAGTYSLEGSSSCLPCPVGTASNAAAPECSYCPMGSYSPGILALPCLQCNAQTYTPTQGLSACIDCQSGYYSGVGSYFCLKCPIGTYSIAGPPYSGCIQCPKANYANQTGTPDQCIACPPGMTTNNIGSTSQSDCVICPPGFYSPGGVDCIQCNPGYISGLGAASCDPCPPGTFADVNIGVTDCADCPVGKYTNLWGSGICLDCLAGQSSNIGTTSCFPCPITTSSSLGSIQGCLDCQAGTFGNVANLPFPCPQCPDGQTSLTKSSSCINCPLGSWSQAPDHSFCQQCTFGFYRDSTSIGCQPCPGGMSNNEDFTSCINCIDSFSPGGSSCSDCPIGTFSNGGALNAGMCTSCDLTKCVSCTSSSTFCLDCQDPLLLAFQGICIEACPIGYYVGDGKSCSNLQCHETCKTCLEPKNDKACYTCYSNKYLRYNLQDRGHCVDLNQCFTNQVGILQQDINKVQKNIKYVYSPQLNLETNICYKICPPGKIVNKNTNICSDNCHSNCKWCSEKENQFKCTFCYDEKNEYLDNFYLNQSICVSSFNCKLNGLCIFNIINSTEILDALQAIDDDLGIPFYKCIKECPIGMTADKSSNICAGCQSNCSSCKQDNANYCLTCFQNLHAFEGRCIKCEQPLNPLDQKKYYFENILSNTSSSNSNESIIVGNSQCLEKCPNGFFGDDYLRECLQCDNNCLACEKFPTYCVSCPNNTLLINYKCYPFEEIQFCKPNQYLIENNIIEQKYLPYQKEQDKCVEQCPKGQFGAILAISSSINNDNISFISNNLNSEIQDMHLSSFLKGVCRKCHSSCYECFNDAEDSCLSCFVNKYLVPVIKQEDGFSQKNLCLDSCTIDQYIYFDPYSPYNQALNTSTDEQIRQYKICRYCPISYCICNSTHPNICQKCQDGYFKFGNQCLSSCKDIQAVFEQGPPINNCSQCFQFCTKCFGPQQNQCLECDIEKGYILFSSNECKTKANKQEILGNTTIKGQNLQQIQESSNLFYEVHNKARINKTLNTQNQNNDSIQYKSQNICYQLNQDFQNFNKDENICQHGICINSKCQCDKGFYGEFCDNTLNDKLLSSGVSKGEEISIQLLELSKNIHDLDSAYIVSSSLESLSLVKDFQSTITLQNSIDILDYISKNIDFLTENLMFEMAKIYSNLDERIAEIDVDQNENNTIEMHDFKSYDNKRQFAELVNSKFNNLVHRFSLELLNSYVEPNPSPNLSLMKQNQFESDSYSFSIKKINISIEDARHQLSLHNLGNLKVNLPNSVINNIIQNYNSELVIEMIANKKGSHQNQIQLPISETIDFRLLTQNSNEKKQKYSQMSLKDKLNLEVNIQNSQELISITLPILSSYFSISSLKNVKCSYWVQDQEKNNGYWNFEGLQQSYYDNSTNSIVCLSSHLTEFGVIQINPSIIQKDHQNIYSSFGFISGLIITSFLGIALITSIFFPRIKRKSKENYDFRKISVTQLILSISPFFSLYYSQTQKQFIKTSIKFLTFIMTQLFFTSLYSNIQIKNSYHNKISILLYILIGTILVIILTIIFKYVFGYLISLFLEQNIYWKKKNTNKKLKVKHFIWVLYITLYITFFIFAIFLSRPFPSELMKESWIIQLASFIVDFLILDFFFILINMYLRMPDRYFWNYIHYCGIVLHYKKVTSSLGQQQIVNTSHIITNKGQTEEQKSCTSTIKIKPANRMHNKVSKKEEDKFSKIKKVEIINQEQALQASNQDNQSQKSPIHGLRKKLKIYQGGTKVEKLPIQGKPKEVKNEKEILKQKKTKIKNTIGNQMKTSNFFNKTYFNESIGSFDFQEEQQLNNLQKKK